MTFLHFRKDKTRIAFWTVSNCETPVHREKYVKKLKEYTQVDVFSKKKCLKSNQMLHCPPERAPVHNHNNATCYEKIKGNDGIVIKRKIKEGSDQGQDFQDGTKDQELSQLRSTSDQRNILFCNSVTCSIVPAA